MRAYWDRDAANFGDELTALIFRQLAGVELTWSPLEEAELVGAGSFVDSIPRDFAGSILGSGSMYDVGWVDLPGANVICVRGHLTARALGLPDVLKADLGLLAADLIQPVADRDIRLGMMRHYTDPRPSAGRRLDPRADPLTTIAYAARCRAIVSSSLHGLVLADSLGIPNMWDPYPGVAGAGFKFRDYASAFGERIEPYVWRVADQVQVAAKRAALLELVGILAGAAAAA